MCCVSTFLSSWTIACQDVVSQNLLFEPYRVLHYTFRSLWEDLRHCRVPLLFIVGEKDAKFRKITEQMYAYAIRKVNTSRDYPQRTETYDEEWEQVRELHHVLVVPDCGHAVHLESPLPVINAIRRFSNGSKLTWFAVLYGVEIEVMDVWWLMSHDRISIRCSFGRTGCIVTPVFSVNLLCHLLPWILVICRGHQLCVHSRGSWSCMVHNHLYSFLSDMAF